MVWKMGRSKRANGQIHFIRLVSYFWAILRLIFQQYTIDDIVKRVKSQSKAKPVALMALAYQTLPSA